MILHFDTKMPVQHSTPTMPSSVLVWSFPF